MDSTTAVTLKALDGLSTRAAVAAENIANASTQGYKPRRVTFEQALQQAAGKGAAAVQSVKAQIGVDTGREAFGGSGPRIDLDLADSASASARYGALVELLSRQMQLTDMAMTEGR